MNLLVADASAVLEFLLRTERGERLGVVLTARGVDLHVPALSDVEVVSALRGLVLRRLLSPERAEEALDDYLDLPLVRHGHLPLLRRAFQLRSNFSAYDATYVALAEALGAALCTADDRLAATVRVHHPLIPLEVWAAG